MDIVNIRINDITYQVSRDLSILEAARLLQVNIPTLCHHPDLPPEASCGLCVVKFKGQKKMLRACATPVEEGMDIVTHDADLYEVRKTVLELILSNHPNSCLTCQRNQQCELQRLAADFGIREESFIKKLKDVPLDTSTPSIILDPVKCIGCGRCAQVCQNIQNVWALEFIGRGFDMRIAPAGDITLNESPCIKCGQCSAHCPVGAIVEKDETQLVWQGLREEHRFPVVQVAPAVRVAFGEDFGLPTGTIVTKKMYSLLRRLGFKAVFDTNFGADLTVMEEANEFVHLFREQPEKLPLITSCCPSWVDYLEKYFPELIEHFSTAKSPHEMLGVMSKTYYAEKHGLKASDIFMVSIMPCTSKKYEITRADEMFASGVQDIDVVLTTRELARMTKASGINFLDLPEEEADNILGEYTGAGVIFGATGGVMEAAVRTAHYFLTGQKLKNVELESFRGLPGIKKVELDIQGKPLRAAVAHGTANVHALMTEISQLKKAGKPIPYHFIEVMACYGGCVSGGGQPYWVNNDIRKKRSEGIYRDDRDQKIRCSHENPYIQKLYGSYLGKPMSEKAHKLLHTNYKARPLYYK
jgi:NADH-quinone oxidoreductase subunit G